MELINQDGVVDSMGADQLFRDQGPGCKLSGFKGSRQKICAFQFWSVVKICYYLLAHVLTFDRISGSEKNSKRLNQDFKINNQVMSGFENGKR